MGTVNSSVGESKELVVIGRLFTECRVGGERPGRNEAWCSAALSSIRFLFNYEILILSE